MYPSRPRPASRALPALLAGALLLLPLPALAAGMGEAVTGGKVNLDVRYRYESVEQTGAAHDATASTLRTRLGYRTGDLGGNTVYLEFEDIVAIGPDKYNSTRNEYTTYPVVLDPEGTGVNQVYLERGRRDGVTLRIGRQRIVLDNARFVGDVGWRQNQQTYDAVSLVDSHTKGVTLTYVYLWNVSGVDFADTAQDSHLVNLAFRGTDRGSLVLYGYWLNNNDAPATSSVTYGGRYGGRYAREDGAATLTLEYARQAEYAGSGIGDNDYKFAEVTAGSDRSTAGAAYEVMGGDGTTAFQTPLATKHAFDGWADQFLTTPADGLVDTAFTLAVRGQSTTLKGVYHRFTADRGSATYGTEWDAVLERKLGDHTLGVKYADYAADSFGADTKKLWVYGEARF